MKIIDHTIPERSLVQDLISFFEDTKSPIIKYDSNWDIDYFGIPKGTKKWYHQFLPNKNHECIFSVFDDTNITITKQNWEYYINHIRPIVDKFEHNTGETVTVNML